MPAAAPNGITVLVAEDEPAVVRLPGVSLPRQGFGAVLARGGEEAVALYKRRHGENLDYWPHGR